LSFDPDIAWHFKVQRDCGSIQVNPKADQNETSIVVEKRFSVIGLYGGLTHRRAPPPAFLFPTNNVKEQNRQQLPSFRSAPGRSPVAIFPAKEGGV